MNVDPLWAEIEAEQGWREAEIRALQNLMVTLPSEEERGRFRRPLVVMLYAHFEGFCKYALSLYVREINNARITCGAATYAIAAVAISDLFEAMRNPDKKCDEFRNELPHDAKLHRFARDREFLERTDEINARIIEIPDSVVDVEDNLKPVVLRKILYRLGLPYSQFEEIEGDIHLLLNYRNKIAHGTFREGVPQDRYDALYGAVFGIMNAIKREILSALAGERFLRAG